MKLTMKRAAVVAALKTCASVADPKSPSAFCKSVLLRAGKKSVEAIATDLNLTVRIDVPATDVKDPVAVVVPAKRMLEVVNAAPGEELTLTFDGGGAVEVKSGRWKGQVPTAGKPADFPKVPEPESEMGRVPVESVRVVLKACLPSVCEDETRFHLGGVLIGAATGVLRGVSSDGHRLAKIERSCEHTWSPVLLPVKACRVLLSTLEGAEDLTVAVDKQRLFARTGWLTLIARLTDAQFVPWQQIVPVGFTNVATFDRAAMLEALDRAKVALGNVEKRSVALDINGEAKLSAHTAEGFTSDDLVDVEHDGPVIETAAEPSYLIDAMRVFSTERVALRANSPLEQILIHAADENPTVEQGDMVIVMPMRRS